MKKLKLVLCFGVISSIATAQSSTINVTYKPNATIGQDATLWLLTSGTGAGVKPCIPTGQSTIPAATNYPNDPVSTFSAWTWNMVGCPNGITRMLIRFPQFDILPSGGTTSTGPNPAVINNATLILHGIPSTSGYYGNSFYTGTATPSPNQGWLYRVSPGANITTSPNNWKENAVTWNAQPNVDPSLAPIPIPVTTSQWNYDLNLDVTYMVKQIFKELNGYTSTTPPYPYNPADSFANNGFLLELQNEVALRQQDYATSDNPDPTLWPELKLEYTLPYPCNAAFSYTNNPSVPLHFTFTADNQTFLTSGGFYKWYIDNNPTSVGNQPTLDWYFSTGGGHQIHLATVYHPSDDVCDKYVRINIAADGSTIQTPSKAGISDNNLSPNPDLNSTESVNYVPKGDDPMDAFANHDITISPNPTEEDWNVDVFVRQETSARVSIYDITGKKIKGEAKSLKAGDNSFKETTNDMAPGIYIIEITGEALNFRQKLSKK
jgi:hypothetical protein